MANIFALFIALSLFCVGICAVVGTELVVNDTSIINDQHLVVEAKSPTAAAVGSSSVAVGTEPMVNNKQHLVVEAESPTVAVVGSSSIASKIRKHKLLSGILAVLAVALVGSLVKGFRCSSSLELTVSQVPLGHAPTAPVQAQPIHPAQPPVHSLQAFSISFSGKASLNENVAVAGDYSNGISAFVLDAIV